MSMTHKIFYEAPVPHRQPCARWAQGAGWWTVVTLGVVICVMLVAGQAVAAQSPNGDLGGLKAKFVNVNGVRTRYYEMGQGEPMVMIHGGMTAGSSTANVFSRNIPGLAKHYHVFAVDRLASGLTGNPLNDSGYSYQGQVEHIYQFIKTMKLGPLHLVGHSAGGAVAFYLAVMHPEMVKTLTLIAAGPEDPGMNATPTKLTGLLKKCPDQTTYAGLKCRVAMIAWLPTCFEDAYWKADEYMAMLPKSKEARAKILAGAGEAQRKAFPAWQKKLYDRVRIDGVLQMPVLLYGGKNDVLDWEEGDATANMKRELSLFDLIGTKNTRVQMIILNNGGHFMYREYPQQFNQDLINFIDFWEHHPTGSPKISKGPF